MEYYSINDEAMLSEEEDAQTFDLSYMNLRTEDALARLEEMQDSREEVTTLLLYQNSLEVLPPVITSFTNLRYLDVSSNRLTELPPEIGLCPLTTLIAKNNFLSEKSLPTPFSSLLTLKEVNFSGNQFILFPQEILRMKNLNYLYLGGNNISKVPKEINNLQR